MLLKDLFEKSTDFEEPLLSSESGEIHEKTGRVYLSSDPRTTWTWVKKHVSYPILAIAISVSLCLNIILLFGMKAPKGVPIPVIGYARLSADVETPLKPFSPYGLGDANDTRRSILWESLNTSPGSVALPNDVAADLGLPKAQPFPWDRSRGLYLVAGFHDLHCLRKVRRWSTIAYHNGTQIDTYKHVVHCFDQLLQSILCHADDLPAVTLATPQGDAGAGQTRSCRSWQQLEQWANQNSACYRFINETQGVSSELERYKWCPQGSAYVSQVQQYFNMTEDEFNEPPPPEIDSIPQYWKDFGSDEVIWDSSWV